MKKKHSCRKHRTTTEFWRDGNHIVVVDWEKRKVYSIYDAGEN